MGTVTENTKSPNWDSEGLRVAKLLFGGLIDFRLRRAQISDEVLRLSSINRMCSVNCLLIMKVVHIYHIYDNVIYILCSGIDDPDINARVWFDNGGIHNEADGNQGSKGQVVQKEPESGSSYNERGRLELVEIGDRYEDRQGGKRYV